MNTPPSGLILECKLSADFVVTLSPEIN